MKKHILTLTTALVFSGVSCLAADVHWGYTGKIGPAHWGKLDPAYTLCAQGKNQSPINLTQFIDADLEQITFHYTGLATSVLNNGHTIQVSHTVGSTIEIGGKIFELKQFHFHAPSENQINGESFPLEAHFVHQTADGSLAVIAVLFQEGEDNPAIARLWQQMPKKAGVRVPLASEIKVDDLMPKNRDYYRFNGSLTTPPCSEGVYWFVLKQPMTVSKEQVEAFAHVMHHPNNRPVQPINARPVLQ